MASTDLNDVAILELASFGEAGQFGHHLYDVVFLELYSEAAIAQDTLLRDVAVLELFSSDIYYGPGSGLSAGDPRAKNIQAAINALREGDRQRVLFTWAGVDAVNTLIRVKRRSIDNTDNHQTIEPDVYRLDDPALLNRQRGGKNPTTPLNRSGNVFRKVNEQRRKMERND